MRPVEARKNFVRSEAEAPWTTIWDHGGLQSRSVEFDSSVVCQRPYARAQGLERDWDIDSTVYRVRAVQFRSGPPVVPKDFVLGSALQALATAQSDVAEAKACACIRQLVEVMDAHFPDPSRDLDSAFMMPIEGVHAIEGRGTVVTGRVSRGVLHLGDAVEITGWRL